MCVFTYFVLQENRKMRMAGEDYKRSRKEVGKPPQGVQSPGDRGQSWNHREQGGTEEVCIAAVGNVNRDELKAANQQ